MPPRKAVLEVSSASSKGGYFDILSSFDPDASPLVKGKKSAAKSTKSNPAAGKTVPKAVPSPRAGSKLRLSEDGTKQTRTTATSTTGGSLKRKRSTTTESTSTDNSARTGVSSHEYAGKALRGDPKRSPTDAMGIRRSKSNALREGGSTQFSKTEKKKRIWKLKQKKKQMKLLSRKKHQNDLLTQPLLSTFPFGSERCQKMNPSLFPHTQQDEKEAPLNPVVTATDDMYMLSMHVGECICFYGSVRMRVESVSRGVEVLGSVISNRHGWLDLHAPMWNPTAVLRVVAVDEDSHTPCAMGDGRRKDHDQVVVVLLSRCITDLAIDADESEDEGTTRAIPATLTTTTSRSGRHEGDEWVTEKEQDRGDDEEGADDGEGEGEGEEEEEENGGEDEEDAEEEEEHEDDVESLGGTDSEDFAGRTAGGGMDVLVSKRFLSIRGFRPLLRSMRMAPLVIPSSWIAFTSAAIAKSSGSYYSESPRVPPAPTSSFSSISSISSSSLHLVLPSSPPAVAPTILFCGARNLGKSMLARFTVNRLLNKYTTVAVLDTDVGQSEFTPPGIVSLSLVEKPLLGPPHTHRKWPLFSFFTGYNSPAEDPAHYLACVRNAAAGYQRLAAAGAAGPIPLVVNTPGWVTGLGKNLLAAIIDIVRPIHIAELQKRGNTDRGNREGTGTGGDEAVAEDDDEDDDGDEDEDEDAEVEGAVEDGDDDDEDEDDEDENNVDTDHRYRRALYSDFEKEDDGGQGEGGMLGWSNNGSLLNRHHRWLFSSYNIRATEGHNHSIFEHSTILMDAAGVNVHSHTHTNTNTHPYDPAVYVLSTWDEGRAELSDAATMNDTRAEATLSGHRNDTHGGVDKKGKSVTSSSMSSSASFGATVPVVPVPGLLPLPAVSRANAVTAADYRHMSIVSYLGSHEWCHPGLGGSTGTPSPRTGVAPSPPAAASFDPSASPPVSFASIGMLLCCQRPFVVSFADVYLQFMHEEDACPPSQYSRVINTQLVGLCVTEAAAQTPSTSVTDTKPTPPASPSTSLSAFECVLTVEGFHTLRRRRDDYEGSGRDVGEAAEGGRPLQLIRHDFRCVGMCLVRAVDVRRKLLYLLCPMEDPVALFGGKKVVLCVANIEVPPVCLYNDALSGGVLPYLTYSSVQSGGQGAQQMKSRNNIQRKKQTTVDAAGGYRRRTKK